jgi:hypothetical protein
VTWHARRSRASRTEARLTEDLLHGRGGDCDAEAVQLTDDPLVAPTRILARQAQHQLAYIAADRRSTTPTAVGPPAGDEASVPAEERRRRDQKRPPARSRQQPTGSSQEDPIGCRQLRTTCLSTKYRQLMPKHDDLQLLELGRTTTKQDELEHAAQRNARYQNDKNKASSSESAGRAHRLYGPRMRPRAETELTHPTRGDHVLSRKDSTSVDRVRSGSAGSEGRAVRRRGVGRYQRPGRATARSASISHAMFAAASAVIWPGPSKGGDVSTTSAPTK